MRIMAGANRQTGGLLLLLEFRHREPCFARVSVVHPCGYTTASHPSGKAQTSTAHWKVADQIPYEGYELHNRRN